MNPKQHTSWFSHIIWLSLSLAAVAYLSTSLHVVSDISQFLPATKSETAKDNVQFLLDELQQGNTARLLILRLRGEDAKSLADISRKLKSRLDKNPLFNTVHNGQNTLNPQQFLSGQYKTLYQYRYLLSQQNDFSSENLATAFKQRLAEIRGGINIFKQTLSSDPQNHFIKYLWQLTSRAETTQHYGVWFSQDKTSALLLVDLKLENFDLDSQQLAIE
ncbi:MAG: hypothetical protein OEW97_01310, partial [Gammaproteobacteria bacterium]|nr:hypothetical protein [Gammaproteobacteria bacterium]